MKQVTIYTTPICHFCHQAKEFFKANNISYTEYDVGVNGDPARRSEMIEKTGQLGVPVIEIGDTIMVGFNKPKVIELLELAPTA